jgi:phosphatidylserine synthase
VVNFRPVPAGTTATAFLVAGVTVLVALCMISSFPYRNYVKALLERRVDIRTAFIVAVSLVGIIFYTRIGLVVFFGLNVLSGPAAALLRTLKRPRRKKPGPAESPS